MPLAGRSSRQCALCVFRSQWGLQSADFAGSRRRQFETSTPSPNVARRTVGRGRYSPDAWKRRPDLPFKPRREDGTGGNGGHRQDASPVRRVSGFDRGARDKLQSTVSANLSFKERMGLETQYKLLSALVFEQFDSFKYSLRRHGEADAMLERLSLSKISDLHDWLNKFEATLGQLSEKAIDIARQGRSPDEDSIGIFAKFRQSFISGDIALLRKAIRRAFLGHVYSDQMSAAQLRNQQLLADLRHPLEWYPATRAMQRKIHLHVGPTNSGKTYQALKRLENAKTGIFAGPLRLLAHEVYTRLNAKGRKCSLVTGEEQRIPEDQTDFLSSCTVEMVPLNTNVDVAVIDEIQMIGDPSRGWAWTQAFLGVKAAEVHVCGELRTIPLITDLCKAMGDTLEVHKYERLSPLESGTKSLQGRYSSLEKGDCVIVFSRLGIHAMKREIETHTGKRCAVVYGSLPPETRAQQAALFNDQDNEYDILVASDAVGMGLNLSIKRVVFEATSKHDGTGFRVIHPQEIKQIGGRAGRYRTAAQAVQALTTVETGVETTALELKKPPPSVGIVTTFEDFDLPIAQRAMATEVEALPTAGMYPPTNIVTRFAAYFPPHVPFSYILMRLQDIANLHPRFHLCNLRDQIEIADVIQPLTLTIQDRLTFIAAPISTRDPLLRKMAYALAKCVADGSGGELLDIPEMPLDLIDADGKGKEYLRQMESLHQCITLYLWLSYRFAGVFRSQALAFHVKSLVEEKIDKCLSEFTVSPNRREALSKMRQADIRKSRRMEMIEEEESGAAFDQSFPTLDGEEAITTKQADRKKFRATEMEKEFQRLLSKGKLRSSDATSPRWISPEESERRDHDGEQRRTENDGTKEMVMDIQDEVPAQSEESLHV